MTDKSQWTWWHLDDGGVLELDTAATPAGCALELQVTVAEDSVSCAWLLETGAVLARTAVGDA